MVVGTELYQVLSAIMRLANESGSLPYRRNNFKMASSASNSRN